MKKIFYAIFLVPVGVVLIVLSVANRQSVTLSLDPFNRTDPALSVTWPFFAFLFAAALIGIVLGAAITWFGQGRYRAEARRQKAEAANWRSEAEKQRKRGDELALSLATGQQTPAHLPAPKPGSKAA